MRSAQQESIDLINFYKHLGRNDALELGYENYDGPSDPVFESAYEKEYKKTLKELLENERN